VVPLHDCGGERFFGEKGLHVLGRPAPFALRRGV
jgi:hypothetical protein